MLARVSALFGVGDVGATHGGAPPGATAPPGEEAGAVPGDVPGAAHGAVPGAVPGAAPAPVGGVLPRLDPGARGAAALIALAVAAVAVTGFVVWHGRPRSVDVGAPAPVVVAASATPAALLVVDVAGEVRRPGLVRLPPGSRVADALAAAGGLRPGATTAGLNLARKVVDGEQVFVGPPGANAAAPGTSPTGAVGAAPGVGASGVGSGTQVNLNTATAEQLDALPGIGPVLAERIVAWRTSHGAFASVDQLREVSGIGARKLESIREYVTV